MSVRKPKDKKIWISRPLTRSHGRPAKSPVFSDRSASTPWITTRRLKRSSPALPGYPPEPFRVSDAAEVIVDAIRSDQKDYRLRRLRRRWHDSHGDSGPSD